MRYTWEQRLAMSRRSREAWQRLPAEEKEKRARNNHHRMKGKNPRKAKEEADG